jgi:outer membrane protein OmpA-like peptidoglycan-associated protein
LSSLEAARIDSFVHGRRPSGISLSGYSDNIGGDAYNDSLSLARADAVRRYLLGRGISDSLIQVNAFGKRWPVNRNGSEEERRLNRRVEIVAARSMKVTRAIVIERDTTAADTPAAVAIPSDTAVTPPDVRAPIEHSNAPLRDLFKDPGSMLGKTVILRDINFMGGHHYPEHSSYRALNDLVSLLDSLPGLTIEIQGFVCCLPDGIDAVDLDTDTLNLSTARARFIYDYLRAKGIDSSRLRYQGFKASFKLYPNETSARERRQNRRVQIKVTGWKP